jgi:endonuclease/exonuclease/phosphatase family metal-dependent hydrolase
MVQSLTLQLQFISRALIAIGVGLVSATIGNGEETLRIATYNASLYGKQAGEIYQRISDGQDRQAQNIAAIVQTVRPDVLLINEIDHDQNGRTARALAQKFFAQPQGSRASIEYPYVYSAPSNTGVDSGLDLNNNDQTGEPNDCWGYGVYPGQYSMAVFSRFPIKQQAVRTFQKFLWKDLPGALRPVDPHTNEPYYDDATWNQLRLSSKNHIDLPIVISDALTLHLLVSHPTPPVFDGGEDRNGCRNHDEIRFWSLYLDTAAVPLVDDDGESTRLSDHASFVIMGDLNADPIDGDGRRQAIKDLLAHDRLRDPRPQSAGAVADAQGNPGSARQQGDPATDTANFGRNGNLRVDFVLPSRNLVVKGSGVFWPKRDTANRQLIAASDHRLVWIDVALPNSPDPPPRRRNADK